MKVGEQRLAVFILADTELGESRYSPGLVGKRLLTEQDVIHALNSKVSVALRKTCRTSGSTKRCPTHARTV
jgi:hypothetical protein